MGSVIIILTSMVFAQMGYICKEPNLNQNSSVSAFSRNICSPGRPSQIIIICHLLDGNQLYFKITTPSSLECLILLYIIINVILLNY